MVICFLLAHFLSTYIIKTESTSTNIYSPSFELNLLSLSKSQVKQETLSFCSEYQKIGSGGYVWQNENYFHAISSAYLNKNDATLVQNSLNHNNIKSEIITIKFDEYHLYGNFNSDESKVLIKGINCPIQYYKQLYDIAISIDTSVYNEVSARMAVNDASNTLSLAIDNFMLLYEKSEIENINSIKSLLKKIKKISQNLCSGTLLNNNQTYSSLVKYRYLEVMDTFYNFLNQ